MKKFKILANIFGASILIGLSFTTFIKILIFLIGYDKINYFLLGFIITTIILIFITIMFRKKENQRRRK